MKIEVVVCDACGKKDIDQAAFGPVEIMKAEHDLCHDCVRDLLQDVLFFSEAVYQRFLNRIKFLRTR